MRVEDVPDECVEAALDAYSDNEWRTSASAMKAALSVVAPLIAKAEREACAAMVDDYLRNLEQIAGDVPGVVKAACVTIAAAIRARGEGEG